MITELSGLGDAMQDGVLYGDPSNGTAFSYVEVPRLSHQGMLYTSNVITPLLDFIELSGPAPNPIDNSSMIFPVYLLCSAVAFVLFLLLIPSLAYTLSSLPLAYEAVAEFLYYPYYCTYYLL